MEITEVKVSLAGTEKRSSPGSQADKRIQSQPLEMSQVARTHASLDGCHPVA